MSDPSPHRRLAASAGAIGLATMASRVLGFVRDILMARLFGTGLAAEAFVVAFRIPNLLRDLVAEGAASTAFVPVFSEYRVRRSPQEYWRLAASVFWIVSLVLTGVTVLGVIAAPLIVRLIAPGFVGNPAQYALTVTLTRWLWPFIWMTGFAAFGGSLLNSLDVFAIPAGGQALLNLGMIAGLVWLVPRVEPGILGAAYGILIGGGVQVASLVWPLTRRGMRWGWPRLPASGDGRGQAGGEPLVHPGTRRIGQLLIPRIVGSAVYQLSVFIDTILASLSAIVGQGGVAALYFANRLIQLPFALFGISLAQASLPTLSAHAARLSASPPGSAQAGAEHDTFKRTLLFATRSAWFITLPSAVGLWVLAEPIVQILFQRGQFDAYSTEITAGVLRWYTLGLVWYASSRLLVNAFYAMQETWIPVKTAAVALTINLVLNVMLMFPMRLAGLALATSIAAMCNCVQLFVLLERRVGAFDRRAIGSSLGRMASAGAVMAVCTHWGWTAASRAWGAHGAGGILALAVVITGSLIVYAAASWLLRVEEIGSLRRWISRSK